MPSKTAALDAIAIGQSRKKYRPHCRLEKFQKTEIGSF
jgi:hypothetical protein